MTSIDALAYQADKDWADTLLKDFEQFLVNEKQVPLSDINDKRDLLRRYIMSALDLERRAPLPATSNCGSCSAVTLSFEKKPPSPAPQPAQPKDKVVQTFIDALSAQYVKNWPSYSRGDFFVSTRDYTSKSKKVRPNLLTFLDEFLGAAHKGNNDRQADMLRALADRVGVDKARHYKKKVDFTPAINWRESYQANETVMSYSATLDSAQPVNWWGQAPIMAAMATPGIMAAAAQPSPASSPKPQPQPIRSAVHAAPPASPTPPSSKIKRAFTYMTSAGSPLVIPKQRSVFRPLMDAVYGTAAAIGAAGTAYGTMALLMSGVSRAAICAAANGRDLTSFAVPMVAAIGAGMAVSVYRSTPSAAWAWKANTGLWNKTRAAGHEFLRGYSFNQFIMAAAAGAAMPLAAEFACDTLADFENAAQAAGVEEGRALLQPSLDQASEQVQQLSEQNEDLIQNNNALLEENNAVEAENERLENENSSLAETNAELQQEKVQLVEENSALQEEVTELAQQTQTLIQENQQLAQEADSLIQQVEELSAAPEEVLSAPLPEVAAETPAEPNFVLTDWAYDVHDVAQGETLSQIALETWGAEKVDAGTALLAHVNGMDGVTANWILPGQDLIVPQLDPLTVEVPALDIQALNDNVRAGAIDFADPRPANAPLPALTLKAA